MSGRGPRRSPARCVRAAGRGAGLGPAGRSRRSDWPVRGAPVHSGRPASSHAQLVASGHASQRGVRAVHTSAPSSISAIAQRAAVAVVRRQQRLGAPALGDGGGAGGLELDARVPASEHPADVGVEHRVPLAEGEGRDRGGGVVADAGQRPQVVQAARHGAAVPVHARRAPRRAAAARGGGSRAGPTSALPRRVRRRRGRPASASASSQASKTGSTRATGVCWSITSLTRTGQPPTCRLPRPARATEGRGRAGRTSRAAGAAHRSCRGWSSLLGIPQDPGRAALRRAGDVSGGVPAGSQASHRRLPRMSTLMHPVGPLRPGAYWLRRFIVLLVVLLIVGRVEALRWRRRNGSRCRVRSPRRPASSTSPSVTVSPPPRRPRPPTVTHTTTPSPTRHHHGDRAVPGLRDQGRGLDATTRPTPPGRTRGSR